MMTPTSKSATIRWKDGTKPTSLKNINKQWMHPADTMTKGCLVYVVKFFGRCEVERPKGTEIVKDAIRKMKFNYSLKRSEGEKPPKVELVISVDGVVVVDLKSKMELHRYPLHRISYCADDKADKKMFTFIAREGSLDIQSCFVFSSEKCAEEIALTVGQAFDLAYQKFLDSYGKETELKKHILTLQHKINDLEDENKTMKKRIQEMEQNQDRNDLEGYLRRKPLNSPTSPRPATINFVPDMTNGRHRDNGHRDPVMGRRVESLAFDNDFVSKSKSASFTAGTPTLISPPPKNPRSGLVHSQPTTPLSTLAPRQPSLATINNNNITMTTTDDVMFGRQEDPFGMGGFNPCDQNYLDMQTGFSQGLAIGTDHFSLEDLDPLYNK